MNLLMSDGAVAIHSRIQVELNRVRYEEDPGYWVQHRLKEHIWSGQRRIMESVRDHRRTAVASCHEAGKSFIAARIVSWWLDKHDVGDAFVVTSAPTGNQVKAILWKEIGRTQTKGLNGRTNQSEWYMTPVSGKEELVAFGRKPSDFNPNAFQGIHARFVLVVFDEACGIPGARKATHSLWDAADSLIANEGSRIIVIGNPDDPESEFESVCRPGSGWNVIHISAFDTPNFTGEYVPARVREELVGHTWVEEKRRKWAPDWQWVDKEGNPSTPEEGVKCVPPEGKKITDSNPLWQSKVLGQFPENPVQGGLIPMSWIRKAMDRELEPTAPVELGVDVGAGGDSSTIAHRRGPVVRIVHEDHNPDTMQTTGNVIAWLKRTGAECAKIDRIGIGKGVEDRGKELKYPFEGINVGEKALDPEEFANLKAEYWWAVRERFETGDIDLDLNDEDTQAELAELRYKRTSRGQIQIESKDEAKRRGVPSPNRAEALMLAFAKPPQRRPKGGLVW